MVINEGYTILAPYFPFFYDAILINVEQKNQDFIVDGLRCNAQGQFQGAPAYAFARQIKCLLVRR